MCGKFRPHNWILSNGHMRCTIIEFRKIGGHTDGIKVASKDPFCIYAQDLKKLSLILFAEQLVLVGNNASNEIRQAEMMAAYPSYFEQGLS